MLEFEEFFPNRTVAEVVSESAYAKGRSDVVCPFPVFTNRTAIVRDLAHWLIAVTFIGDVVLILCGLCFAFFVRFQMPIREVGILSRSNLFDYSGFIACAAFTFLALLANRGIYDHRLILNSRLIASRIFRWSFVWLGILLFSTYVLKFEPPISRFFCLMAWLVAPSSLLLWRSFVHFLITHSSIIESLRRRVAFVGWNEETTQLVESFRRDPESAYRAVGYFEFRGAQMHGKPQVPFLGNIEEFEQILVSAPFDFVLLADFNCDRESVFRLARMCDREMVAFKVIPGCFQELQSGLELETMGGIPVMGVNRLPLDRIVNRVVKRLFDIVGGAVGLVLSVPLIVIFGGLIYMKSPGPIFYRQRRFGRNGKPFVLVNLRTGHIEQESAGGPGHMTRSSPAGFDLYAFMRLWNIEKVSQFWNVLKGEMSLIGPRPERHELINAFKHQIPHYNARHRTKPGITGWAQVRGIRGNANVGEQLKHELWYLENWSIWLDIQILFMTLMKQKNKEY